MSSWEALRCWGLLGHVLRAAGLLHSSPLEQDLCLSGCPTETERRQWEYVDIQGVLDSIPSLGCLEASHQSTDQSEGLTSAKKFCCIAVMGG